MSQPPTRTVVCRITDVRRGRTAPDVGYEILLSIEEVAYPAPTATDVAQRLERIQRARAYIFLDLGPGNIIRSFRLAHTGFVRRVTRAEHGYYVQLEDDASAHFIALGPDTTAIIETILSAQHAHRPIALRTATVCEPVIAVAVVPELLGRLDGPVTLAPDLDAGSITTVSYAEAVQYFNLLAGFTYPKHPDDPYIATYWIVSGCQARAQRFCQILHTLDPAVRPAKKWAWAGGEFMAVEPPNMPCCRIGFDVHVAVALRAGDCDGYYVLDHALFAVPVTEDVWLSKLVHPAKQSEVSEAGTYIWARPDEPPRREIDNESETALRYGRIAQEEMIHCYGPPPYHSCFITTHAAIREWTDRAPGSAGAEGKRYPLV